MSFLKMRYKTLILFTTLLIGCSREGILNPKAYMAFLNNSDNGLIKEKTVAGVKFKIKYLPSEFISYNLLKNQAADTEIKDSVIKSYQNSLTFLLNIGPADNEKFDITRVDIADYSAFADRIEEMAFQTQNYISLACGDSIYKPAITRMENINSPEKSRNFIVVFNSEKGGNRDLRKHDMSFIYRDEMFNTGVNKFVFHASDINALPEFKF